MLPILDNDGMREADRHTIEDLGVPSLVLMENAATGVVEAIRDSFPDELDGRRPESGPGTALFVPICGSAEHMGVAHLVIPHPTPFALAPKRVAL